MSEVTRILSAIEDGDPSESEQLLPLVYAELRSLADARLRREANAQSVQATMLVHEAYLRLVGHGDGSAADAADEPGAYWRSRAHFFGAAAEAMRRILIDRARMRRALKRGGGQARSLRIDPEALLVDDVSEELVDLDDVLSHFEREHPRKAQLVKLRFFGGCSLEQAAAMLGISLATASRDWAFGRAWLYRALAPDGEASR